MKSTPSHVVSRIKNKKIVTVMMVLIAAFMLFSAQSKDQLKPKKRNVKATVTKIRADSISAATRAIDSLRVAKELQVVADSIKRQSDSLAQLADTVRPFEFRKIKNQAFGVGERLTFDVHYGFITAGEAIMAVAAYDSVAGRKCYRIEFSVNSLPSFSWIYRVEDRYLTFIDLETIAPWKFEQHIREGTYRRDFTAEFDQVHRVARTSEGIYPTPEYVHDIMSSFYYARTLDFTRFQPGDGVVLHNFHKDTSHELKVKFLGRQELEVEAGTFNTIVVEPLVKEGGLFKSEGRIVIWLTDDERKIPVRVNTKVIIGSIDTELREYAGLAGPLRARIR
jgi:hypothetical protein